jgi:hypothetical protein
MKRMDKDRLPKVALFTNQKEREIQGDQTRDGYGVGKGLHLVGIEKEGDR